MFLNDVVPDTGWPVSIISLVPSQTELLHYLGLDKEVTGITKFCIHPEEWFRSKTKIGGTKTLSIEKIQALHPTLIIANKEENIQAQVEKLIDYPVWLTDVNNLDDACRMITDLGKLTGTIRKSEQLVEEIRTGFSALEKVTIPVKVAYLIWKDPYMTVGGDTFIHDMITRTGMRNVFANAKRYPEVTIEDIKISGCEVLFLSSEPYPFKQKHAEELSRQLPGLKIKIVDGEMFSWYGSRLLKSFEYFKILQADLVGM